MPFLVNQTRWSDLIKQLAVAKGLDHVEVMGQLLGAIVLENDRPEHKYLAGEAMAAGQFLGAAVAAVVTSIGIRNPTGSGKIVVLEWAAAVLGTQNAFTLGRVYCALVRGATLTQANTEQPRDTRLQPTGAFGTAAPNIAGQIVSGRSDTIVVTPFVIAELICGIGNTAVLNAFLLAEWRQPVVLAPGDAFLMFPSDGTGGTIANLAIQGSFAWRERTLEPTET